MTEQEINLALEENRRRNKTLATDYNPLSGRGACGPRLKKRVKWEQGYLWLPESMMADPESEAGLTFVSFQCRIIWDMIIPPA